MSTTKAKSKKKTKKIKKLPLIGPKSYFAKPWQDWLCIGLIAFLCYAPILQNDFVGFDDPALITNNPVITDSDWSRVWTWGLYSPYYKPLVFTSWKLEKMLFGFNPSFFHLNNLLLHLFNCFMVYLIVGRLCQFWEHGRRHQYAIAFWTSFAFALHPMHVESVAWAVERKDVLFAAFFFVGWYCYLRYVESQHFKWMAWTAVAYVCSLFCKAPGIMLIAILFLHDFLAKRPLKGKLFIEKIPVMTISLLALYFYGIFHKFSWYTRGASGGITGEEAVGVREIAESSSVLAQMLWVNFKLLFWFFHSLLPFKLSIAYPRTELLELAQQLNFILPVLTLGIAYLLWRSLSSNRLLFFCAGFFVATLLPALTLNDHGIGILLSDRYTYVPLFGFTLFLVLGIYFIADRWMPQIKSFAAYAIIGLLGCYGISTFTNAKVWNNSESLWTNAIDKYPTIAYPYANRSKFYLDMGQAQKAMIDLNKALQLNPKDDASLVERARAYRLQKQYDFALKDLSQAIQLNPKNLTARLNRGNVYHDKQLLQQSLADFDFILKEAPEHISALTNRSSIYGQLGRRDEAIRDLNKVIKTNANNEQAYNNLIFIYFDMGKFQEALQNANQYLSLRPEDHEIYHVRGVIQQSLGQQQLAIQDFSRAIQMNPSVGQYYLSRATAYQATGQNALAQSDQQRGRQLSGK